MAAESRFVWLLGVLTLILRILLWPLRRLVVLLFPPKDLDGLSPAVTSKAVQSFVSELRKQSPGNVALEALSTSGFNALRTEAASSNQLILVYLHSPLHRQGNLVRNKLLLNDAVLQFLNDNQDYLVTMGVSIHTAQGAHLAQLLGAASYPLVALLQPSGQSALQLVFRAEGPMLQKMTATQFLSQLQNAVQRHQMVVAEAEARRIQREQEAQLRREQDLEFQETLRADQERQRLQQEAEQRELERVQLLQQESQRLEQEKERKLQEARDLLKPEPSSGGTRVRFVLPTGAKIDRRFESSESIKSLRAFLTIQMNESDDMNEIENIGLSTSYPKRSYDEDENEKTLEEAGLSPQAVLMVQDLDA